MKARSGGGWITFSVIGLVVMVTWTLVIKYLVPVLYFAAESAAGRRPEGAPVMWDFWWVVHIALALLLWRRHPWGWITGVTVCSVEIAIVLVKFILYAGAPDFSLWGLLWLTNKIYVLSFFMVLLILLNRQGVRMGWGARHDEAV